MSVFEGIMTGLRQALAYERGEASDVVVVERSLDLNTQPMGTSSEETLKDMKEEFDRIVVIKY